MKHISQGEKKCCKNHDNMEDENGYYDCGMAGMGAGLFCCKQCPDLKWQKEHEPTRGIEFWK